MNLLFTVNMQAIEQLNWCLHSILRFENDYDIYIAHSELTGKAEENLKCSFMHGRVSLHFIKIDNNFFNGFPESNRYPKEIYYRLRAADFLPDYLDRVLYLDVDTLVLKPLDELYYMDFEDNYFIACTHIKKVLAKFNELRLGLDKGAAYINTGVLLMNLELLRNYNVKEQVQEIAKTKTLFLPDQDIISILYGNHIKLIDFQIYNLSDCMVLLNNWQGGNETINEAWIREHTVILHFCGKNKPWKKTYNGLLGKFFYEFQEQQNTEVYSESPEEATSLFDDSR